MNLNSSDGHSLHSAFRTEFGNYFNEYHKIINLPKCNHCHRRTEHYKGVLDILRKTKEMEPQVWKKKIKKKHPTKSSCWKPLASLFSFPYLFQKLRLRFLRQKSTIFNRNFKKNCLKKYSIVKLYMSLWALLYWFGIRMPIFYSLHALSN